MSATVLDRRALAEACAADRAVESIAMLQLRHLTKNALQRIIAQISVSGLRATFAGSRLAEDLEERICLSARISDALFGMTASPGSLHRRLVMVAEATVALLGDDEQMIATEVTLTGACPGPLEATVVQVAHEMVGNAVKHGMQMRLVGRIKVEMRARDRGGVTLSVSDDGWGPSRTGEGGGLPIMRMLAERHGGTVTLDREADWTVARVYLNA